MENTFLDSKPEDPARFRGKLKSYVYYYSIQGTIDRESKDRKQKQKQSTEHKIRTITTFKNAAGTLRNLGPKIVSNWNKSWQNKMTQKNSHKELQSGTASLYKTKNFEKKCDNHVSRLISRYSESIDGGYLAPYFYYPLADLSYATSTLRSLIIFREMAPFYVPIIDKSDVDTREKMIKKLILAGPHQKIDDIDDDEEFIKCILRTGEWLPSDLYVNVSQDSAERSTDRELIQRQRSDLFKSLMTKKRVLLQEIQIKNQVDLFSGKVQPEYINKGFIPSNDLFWKLYSELVECDICHYFYPKPLNKSHCCSRTLCTECFIHFKRERPFLISRKDLPQFMASQEELTRNRQNSLDDTCQRLNLLHTEPSTEASFISNSNELDIHSTNSVVSSEPREELVSKPVKCPFCHYGDFRIVYQGPPIIRTGIGGIPPRHFSIKKHAWPQPNQNAKQLKKISPDYIYPSWRKELEEAQKILGSSSTRTAFKLFNTHYTRNGKLSANASSVSPEVGLSDTKNLGTTHGDILIRSPFRDRDNISVSEQRSYTASSSTGHNSCSSDPLASGPVSIRTSRQLAEMGFNLQNEENEHDESVTPVVRITSH